MLKLGALEDAMTIFLLQKMRSHGMLGDLLRKGRPILVDFENKSLSGQHQPMTRLSCYRASLRSR
jgi:hypothetical protein